MVSCTVCKVLDPNKTVVLTGEMSWHSRDLQLNLTKCLLKNMLASGLGVGKRRGSPFSGHMDALPLEF